MPVETSSYPPVTSSVPAASIRPCKRDQKSRRTPRRSTSPTGMTSTSVAFHALYVTAGTSTPAACPAARRAWSSVASGIRIRTASSRYIAS